MKKPHQRTGSLASLAEVLPGLCEDLALDQKVNEMALLTLWPQQAMLVTGIDTATRTKAVRLKKQGERTILQVRVEHATLAAELGFYLPAVKEALNRFAPQTGLVVDEIRLSVGKIE